MNPESAPETPPERGFVRILRLDVRHAYFRGSVPRGLRFEALPDTRAFLDAFGVRVREDGHGLSLYAEAERLDALSLEGAGIRSLDFLVLSADPLGHVYTAPAKAPGVFGPSVSADGELLSAEAGGGGPDLSGSALSGLALALARLALPARRGSVQDWRAALGRLGLSRALSLAARGTLWKYLLLGAWGGSPRVVDLAGEVAFTDPRSVLLENGASALAIFSDRELPLREHSPLRFQLRDAAARPERVLIKRLPVAAPERFHREPVEGRPAFISEIFIHH